MKRRLPLGVVSSLTVSSVAQLVIHFSAAAKALVPGNSTHSPDYVLATGRKEQARAYIFKPILSSHARDLARCQFRCVST